METAMIASALTYALFRSVEALAKLMWTWYRDFKEEEQFLEQEDERRNRQ